MKLLCYFGHHRSASSWTRGILQSVCIAAGWPFEVVHNASMFQHDLSRFITDTQPELLIFSNAKAKYLADLPAFQGLHVIRDPRDVLVSSYFSHRNSHPTDQWPELVAHQAELQALNQHDGLLQEIECRREQFEDMASWPPDLPTVYEVKMEVLTAYPKQIFAELFAFWGRLQPSQKEGKERRLVSFNKTMHALERRVTTTISLPRWRTKHIWPWLLEEIIDMHTFHRVSGGRRVGETNVFHHYRSGITGDWRNHFSPKLTEQFKVNYGDLLIQLGYEETIDW